MVDVYAIAAPAAWTDWDAPTESEVFTKGALLGSFEIFNDYNTIYYGEHPTNGFLLEPRSEAWWNARVNTFVATTNKPKIDF